MATISITLSQPLAMAQRMARNTTSSEIPGAPTGEKKDTSESQLETHMEEQVFVEFFWIQIDQLQMNHDFS